MKKFLEAIIQGASEFLGEKSPLKTKADLPPILAMIDTAMNKQSGVHVIFQDKSFTGDIVKYDSERNQLILKNFRRNVSTIIRIDDIKRIRLVPKTISEAQKKNED